MRLKLEQALNSEMVLKMQLEQKMKPTSQRNQSPCCGCQRDYTQERALVPASQVPQSQTFYTELTVQVSRIKLNTTIFIRCITKYGFLYEIFKLSNCMKSFMLTFKFL